MKREVVKDAEKRKSDSRFVSTGAGLKVISSSSNKIKTSRKGT